MAKKTPQQQAAVGEQRVGNALARDARDPAEDEREDQHQSDRLEQRPTHPEDGLLVANPNTVGGESPKQIDVPRHRPQIGCKPLPMAGTTDRHESVGVERVHRAQSHSQLICKAGAFAASVGQSLAPAGRKPSLVLSWSRCRSWVLGPWSQILIPSNPGLNPTKTED